MSESDQRRLIMLFCLRCCDVLGTLRETDIAFALRITVPELLETKQVFIERGFIDDSWSILNWDKRQYPSDSSTERTRKYRERMRTSRERHSDGLDKKRIDTEKTKTKTAPPKAPLVVDLPDWISKESWDGFTEMRGKKRVPNTPRALNGIVRALEKLRLCGTDPNESLDQSTMRGWSGVFEVRNGNGKHKDIYEAYLEENPIYDET